MKNGKLQIDSRGNKEWYLNGKLHRLDGPAYICSKGFKYWFLNGKHHRLDGPAIIWADCSKFWWVNNIEYTEYEFNNMILTRWRRLFS